MGEKIYNLAFDFGASSGRMVLCKLEDGKLTLEELHRFPNHEVRVGGHIYWDLFGLYHELKQGLKKAAAKKVPIQSLAIDTWGVDYGLFDKDGNLIGNPVNYRDSRTDGMLEEIGKIIPLEELYNRTGIEFMYFNSIFQLYAEKKMRPVILDNAKRILFMPELFGYFLTGIMYSEYTFASTSQLLDARKRQWDYDLIEKLGLNKEMFGDIVMPGTVIGDLLPEVEEETGLKGVKVIAVGSHDTASAVAGAPLESDDAAFLSCGTWSLLGMVLDEPILNEASYKYNYTNEGSIDGKIQFLKNINGLWIMQNLRRNWCEFEGEVSFPDIIREARAAKRQDFTINPKDPRFTAPLNMMKEISGYCRETGQGTPEGLGEMAMAIYNGLTEEYRKSIQYMEEITGKTVTCINMVGGGIQDQLLCELTAKKTGKRVMAGPVEGSVLGNSIVQLVAMGEVKDVQAGRDIIRNSFDVKIYEP